MFSEGTFPDVQPKIKGYKVMLAECKELPDRAGRGIRLRSRRPESGEPGGRSEQEKEQGKKRL